MQKLLPKALREARPEQVAATEARVTALLPYRDQAALLREAETTDIARQLDEVPAAARRTEADLRRELAEKRAARETAEKLRDQQATALVRMHADRLQRAEVEALTGLSQGRLRLELRPGKDGEDAAQKALDLLVYNRETGEQPTLLAAASGSQKFRIALSLALAIGRYLARETRRVESVIIDEGFGCLDRANREEAVTVLRDLGGHLARVILVSHQEELTGRFNSGYRIDLVDRTSVSTRVSR
jgi:DNA repair exonuclease SbcCD ATPase subunit